MSSFYTLDFEKPVAELERRIRDAETPPPGAPAGVAQADSVVDEALVRELSEQRDAILAELYSKLDPWDTVRVSRHPDRPQSRDYIQRFVRDFAELHGDRRFGDDPAIVTGLGRIGSHKCMIVGHQKGCTTQERIACHFGCAHPEGYRKALLKMELAEKMGIPIVTLVDTPGAYPGLGAEERGQAEAIAVNLREMSRLKTPIVSVVIGEGGSGGALGIAVADRVAMMQHAWYSVISPEGCAAILWKQANETTNAAAATALNLTAEDNLRNGIIDDVVSEPIGGAHRHRDHAAKNLADWITTQLDELVKTPTDALLEHRYQRFRKLGEVAETTEAEVDAATPDAAAQNG
ncbi:MAG: acetyl-CoA carboxylase carboxyltransferase subunit alpha [Planctomycetota bacterium]